MKTIIKRVFVDWSSLESMQKAEKQKTRLENLGYTLIESLVTFNTATLIYERIK